METLRHTNSNNNSNKLSWWQLALFGIGCTIGTGFFLGSSIAIQKSGFLVVAIFLLAALATLFVYEALAQMTAANPEKGSFRNYVREAYGRWAGFGVGWLYWSSEMLILGSSLTAIGIFTQFWFPNLPLWLLTACYSILAIFVIILGSKGINKTENICAIVKMGAVFLFIAIAGIVFIKGTHGINTIQGSTAHWFGSGWTGAWKGLLYAFYAFSGIEVMGFMAIHLRNPKEATKAGRIMLLAITVLYVVAISLALLFITKEHVTPDKSPLLLALGIMKLPILVHIMNGVLIIAGFSILVASLYGVSTMLVALAEGGDAPPWLANKKGKKQLPLYALGVNTIGLSVSIVLALVMPSKIFEHITTAGGLVLLYTWLLIVASYLKQLRPTLSGHLKSWSAILLIMVAVTGPLLEQTGRPGFWTSLLIVLVIILITWWMKHHSERTEPA
ncbi:amino acid permease [Paenibacillus qinlingensis]|uniref:L-asparagine transporter-like permease n=1 Tax=Paenibacillus qinlingensis TaxID=1837343 RepID=A0ABU1NT27_9BACL|nr:amino acid permease [Paenibacillus qinlingensis]MDR6550638.1 L-asparagine transporter-like permease [Paenibacillus qinlingensis]